MRRRRRRRTALIKSNNPHLAGGAKNICMFVLLHVWVIKSWFVLSLSCIDSICYLINIWRTLPDKMMVRQTL